MIDEAILFRSISDIAPAIAAGKLRVSEIVRLLQQRIERLNDRLNAYISLNPQLLEQAEDADRAVKAGRLRGPLHGVPVSIKDLIFTRDLPTTGGSRVHGSGLEAGEDADVVRRLRTSGTLIIGKTNLHEFAFGVTNENPHFGPARNPWDTERISGGSSGGSAVALAAGLCFGSLGTDTRGSVRMPAACCGITGLKPTFGIVSTQGVIPLSPTLDHVGPMARSVEDCALLLCVLAGRRSRFQDYREAMDSRPAGLTIGLCEYFRRDLAPEVESALREAEALFEKAGARLVDVSMQTLDDALAASGVISLAEAAAFHEESLRRQPEDFDPVVRTRLEGGFRVTGIEMVRALQSRVRVGAEFTEVFRGVDILLGATLPVTAPSIGSVSIRPNQEEPIVAGFVRLNAPQNMAGVPALSLPAGFSREGLPLAIQLIAGHRREDLLFRAGAHFQRETDFHRRIPPQIHHREHKETQKENR